MRARERATKGHLPRMWSSDDVMEAARDKRYGGEIVGRKMGNGMDEYLCAELALGPNL